MALAIDSTDLFDLDAQDDSYEEHLFLLKIGSRYLLVKTPTTKQLTGVSLALSGKKGDPTSAVRDFLDSVIVPLDEADDYREIDEELPTLIENGSLVDVDFLIEKVQDPRSTFSDDNLSDLVQLLMKRATGFPTKRSSASSPSQPTTGSASPAASRRVASKPSS